MNSIKLALLSIVLIALGIVIGLQIPAIPLLSMQDNQAPTNTTKSKPDRQTESDQQDSSKEAETPATDTGQIERLSRDYLNQVLVNLDSDRRQQLLADREMFHDFVEQEASNRSIQAAARANEIQQNDNVALMMARASNRVLREMYINQLMREQLPADFPTSEQVRQFYENNQARFKTPERVQVWQVFLEAVGQPAQDAPTVEQQARKLLQRIRAGEVTMAAAAIEHSAHAPSRRNDGYMGAVQTGELKPAIADALKTMQQGDYGLAQSEDGWHILKKGRTLAAAPQPFENVRQQARQWLVSRIQQQFRQAVIERASKEYSFMPSDNRIEQWRLELKTGADG